MSPSTLRVLLIVEQCNPEWPSVPLEGFRYYEAIRRFADVTLATHERNRQALTRAGMAAGVVFIPESPAVAGYFRAVGAIAVRGGRVNWPILYALGYPVYAEFNRRVYRTFREPVLRGDYDLVHAFSPIIPRYPVALAEACRTTPFVLGPVNGGLAFPRTFGAIARREFSRFRFLRASSRLIPGYRATYLKADKVLAGSSATLAMLQTIFDVRDDRMELFHENGVVANLFGERPRRSDGKPLSLLFAGRLVPFKCADAVVEALGRLDATFPITLTIVGDGPERKPLEEQARRLGLANRVIFAGWAPHERMVDYYRQADVFCFPSIREFGGAVVLEAMATGLPCIVTNYGGIAEYVTDQSGFRIDPTSRENLVHHLARHIETLFHSADLWNGMSAAAAQRAAGFEWSRKGRWLVEKYAKLVERKRA
jgi:glycosyltransferase involved in cell wall biosynthesis